MDVSPMLPPLAVARTRSARLTRSAVLLLGIAAGLFATRDLAAQDRTTQSPAQSDPSKTAAANPASLDEMRLAMSKWIETQQIIAKERKDWQQSKEILTSRIELVRKEIATLEQKIADAKS